MRTNAQCLAISYYLFIINRTVEIFKRAESLRVTDDNNIRIFAYYSTYRAAVVRFVMIYDEVVDFSVAKDILDLAEMLRHKLRFHRVDKCNLVINNKI